MVTTVVIFGASGDLTFYGFWRRSENLARSIHKVFYYNRRYESKNPTWPSLFAPRSCIRRSTS